MSSLKKIHVTIVGAGLAGSEAALVLSRFSDVEIKLIEMRPKKQTDVHKTGYCAELVCSNSFKSLKFSSAAGMIKYELATLASPVFECALNTKVDAGNALAVDRDLFSNCVTQKISQAKNIDFVCDEFTDIKGEMQNCDALILATGPLTSNALYETIKQITGTDELAFYDAAAPIVMADSLDINKVFSQNRYSQNEKGDYLNAVLSKDEYKNFIDNLLNAKCVIKKSFESKDLFQACQPIEEVARSGFDAPRYGALKPTGIDVPNSDKRAYAVVQLRPENAEKTAYNLVGFQTNLTFPEQKRVFSLIPGLENAEFVRYGVMHKNTFINAPKLLDQNLCFNREYLDKQLQANTYEQSQNKVAEQSLCKIDNKLQSKIYFAGQLSGTEGYLEAVRSGYHAAISVISKFRQNQAPELSRNTAFGALLYYATNTETKKYQPMHVNFGLMPPLEKNIRNKKERYTQFSKRGKIDTDNYRQLLIDAEIFNKKEIESSKNLLEQLDSLWVKN